MWDAWKTNEKIKNVTAKNAVAKICVRAGRCSYAEFYNNVMKTFTKLIITWEKFNNLDINH